MSLVEKKQVLESGFNPNVENTYSDDEDLEREKNQINKKFVFEWTKWMRKEQIDEYLDRFTCVRVPTGTFERCFLYYRRYPNDFGIFEPIKVDNKVSLYQASNKLTTNNKGMINLNTPKIDMKTYDNPYA